MREQAAAITYEKPADDSDADRFFRRLEKVFSRNEEGFIKNVAVRGAAHVSLLSRSAELAAIEIRGKEASALLIGSRPILNSLSSSAKAELSTKLDALVKEFGFELLQHTDDEQMRQEMVARLTGGLPNPGNAVSATDLDIFIYAGRIGDAE